MSTDSIRKDSIRNKENSLIKSTIKDYINVCNSHKIDSIGYFFADTIKTYFFINKQINKEDIIKEKIIYWKNYPKDTFFFSSEPIEILKENAIFKVIFKGTFCIYKHAINDKCREVMFEIFFRRKI